MGTGQSAIDKQRNALNGYGSHRFSGNVAAFYLAKQGLDVSVLDSPDWTASIETADKVAAAVLEWARDKGAHTYCHVFQPMGGSVRHGQVAQVQESMFSFAADGSLRWDFDGDMLLRGETDGSSFPNGGLRATHTAAAYLALDPFSSIFLRGDAIYIPASMVSWRGQALDEKTPLMRANQYLSQQGTRLMGLLGVPATSVCSMIGLEQEFFLIPRDAYYKRPDLQLCGRTVLGKDAPRGQEMCDHYMAPMNSGGAALACFQDAQDEAFKMGIPLKTRHREVAPNQFECAPLYGTVGGQIDQNLMVMQMLDEVAAKHGLACLLQEKPFQGINGSGKHNNWSLATDSGLNLFHPGKVAEVSGDPETFAVIMAAVVSAVDKHGDLMRMAIASPGNDFRLGACEAPPAIISTYLGDDLKTYMDGLCAGAAPTPYTPQKKTLSFGVAQGHLQDFKAPAEDRNRTSPFPYGNNRFEFRAVGSSQNVSMVNTVLNMITADAFKCAADMLESGSSKMDVVRSLYGEHSKCVFNGNGYSAEWPVEAGERGVWRIDSGVDAIQVLTSEKNMALFSQAGVLEPEECAARQEVMLEHYIGYVDMECKCMIDMFNQHILPSIKNAGLDATACQGAVAALTAGLHGVEALEDTAAKAAAARTLRLETMVEARAAADAAEAIVPAALWTLGTYNELLFLDFYPNSKASCDQSLVRGILKEAM